jgi:hypothetical protein
VDDRTQDDQTAQVLGDLRRSLEALRTDFMPGSADAFEPQDEAPAAEGPQVAPAVTAVAPPPPVAEPAAAETPWEAALRGAAPAQASAPASPMLSALGDLQGRFLQVAAAAEEERALLSARRIEQRQALERALQLQELLFGELEDMELQFTESLASFQQRVEEFAARRQRWLKHLG